MRARRPCGRGPHRRRRCFDRAWEGADYTEPLVEAFRLGAKEAARLIERGELSVQALLESCRERIAEREPQVQAWTCVAEDFPPAGRPRAPLFGVPVGVKDI